MSCFFLAPDPVFDESSEALSVTSRLPTSAPIIDAPARITHHDDPPKFITPLCNQTAPDGERIVFLVRFRGFPPPVVTWYFNGQLIESSPDFRISEDHERGESVMTIVELFPDDEGEYMCKVENSLGTAVTHCHLFVRRKCIHSFIHSY